MKKFLLLSICIMLLNASTYAQKEPPTIKSVPTYEVTLNEDITYAQGLSHDSTNSESASIMDLNLDIYSPDNEDTNKPVFVFIHGGGFSGGSKQQERIITWANYFASRGWVFISVDYRLKKHKGTIPQQWDDYCKNVPPYRVAQFQAIYPAHRDAKASLRWVVANADTYGINTDYITVGGGSAGAITAISAGVSQPEDFRDELTLEQDPTLATTNLDVNYDIKTIIDLWGSKIAMDALTEIYKVERWNNELPPLMVVHGTDDPTVPYSSAIELRAIYNNNNAPLAYYPLKGTGHGAWGSTVNDKKLEELAFDFIIEQQGMVVE